jgi:hypothetical protein
MLARFQVLTAASVKTRAFWDVALCSLVEVDHRFEGTYCLHHQMNTLRESSVGYSVYACVKFISER